MSQSIAPSPPKQQRRDDEFGAGCEVFVRILRNHDELSARLSQADEETAEITENRRAWKRGDSGRKDGAGFEWTMPEMGSSDDANTYHQPHSMQFFAVDEHPFMALRIEANDNRGGRQDANFIVQGSAWSEIDFDIPNYGSACLIDLAPLKALPAFGKRASVQIDRDGSIVGHFSIDPGAYYSPDSLCGGLTGVTTSGVIRGWASVVTDRSRDLLLTAVFDNSETAHFYAREQYGAHAHLKRFSYQIPTVYLDGKLHRLDLRVSGSGVRLEGTPIFFVANPFAIIVLSSVRFEGGRFSASIVETTDVGLEAQSAAVDAARIADTRRLLASPSWIVTAPLRAATTMMRGAQRASLLASNVTLDNRLHLRDLIVNTQSWRVTASLRAVLSRLAGFSGSRFRSASEGVFGPPVGCAVKRGDAITFRGRAAGATMASDTFSAGFSGFIAPLPSDLGSSVLELTSPCNGATSEISLHALKSLSDA